MENQRLLDHNNANKKPNYGKRNDKSAPFRLQIPENIHKFSIPQLESLFTTSSIEGLNYANHLRNLNLYGSNEMRKPKGKPLIIVFILEHLLSKFNIIASSGAIATIVLDIFQGFTADDISFVSVLAFIVLFTALYTFFADLHRSNVIEKLQEIGQVTSVLVKRNNTLIRVDGKTLVPGDIVFLGMGDKVPADMIVLESQNLKVDNSSMTGESLPVKKSPKVTNDELFRSENVLLYSTHVQEGNGVGMVFATANNTRLAKLFNFETPQLIEETPMVAEINQFMYVSIIMASFIVAILFTAAVIQHKIYSGISFSISILISFIPEGLVLSYLSAQTITANKLSKHSIHIKKLKASEIFGNMTTLFMDKTGTITENKLHVSNFIEPAGDILNAQHYQLDDRREVATAIIAATDSLLASRLRNNGSLTEHDYNTVRENSLETCLMRFVYEKDPDLTSNILHSCHRVYTMPFNSVNKYSYAIVDIFEQNSYDNDTNNNINTDSNRRFVKRMLFAKGAPEYLLKVCRAAYPGFFDFLMEKYMFLANSGERAIAVAKLDLTHLYSLDHDFDANPLDLKLIDNLEFLSIVSMRDRIRDTSVNTIMNLRSAGISIIMVTGDHAGTARYVAKKSGIILARGPTADEIAETRGISIFDVNPSETSAIVMTGAIIENLSQERLAELFIAFPEVVIARCSPQNKIQAIEAMQSINKMLKQKKSLYSSSQDFKRIVGVIGDGTNDAPALKTADLGISMGGNNGTELTQEVAWAIVENDNTLGILHAVKNSRQLRDNTLKGIGYMSRSLMVEMLPAIFMFFFNMVPLNMASIMIVQDVILSMIPNISIAFEPTESDIMRLRPEKLRERSATSFANICQNFFLYSAFGLVLSITIFALTYSTIGMTLSDTFFINTLFSDKTLLMRNNDGDLLPFKVRNEVKNNAIMEYMKINVIVQMFMLIISKTRRISIFSHGIFNNPYLLSVVIFNMIVCLIITIIQARIFAYIELGLFILVPLTMLVMVYGFILILIYDEARKYLIRKYNVFNYQSLMFHVYS